VRRERWKRERGHLHFFLPAFVTVAGEPPDEAALDARAPAIVLPAVPQAIDYAPVSLYNLQTGCRRGRKL
jgi:hypothetical protein